MKNWQEEEEDDESGDDEEEEKEELKDGTRIFGKVEEEGKKKLIWRKKY